MASRSLFSCSLLFAISCSLYMPLYVLGALTEVEEEDDDTDGDRFPLDETRFKSSTMGAGVVAGAAEDSVVVVDDGVDLHSVCT